MTTQITTNKSFQERMFERVREQMGDLMTDEELKKIVDQAAQRAFFDERIEYAGSYNQRKIPSLFVELMGNELKARVSTEVIQWLRDNPEIVEKAIQDVLKEGMLRAVMSALENRMSWPVQQLADILKQKGVFN